MTVTLVTMGRGARRGGSSPRPRHGRRRCRPRLGRSLAEADSGATAEALRAVAERLGFDLICVGRVAIDDAAAQVGLRLAEKLGIPTQTRSTKLDMENGKLDRQVRNRGRSGSAPNWPCPRW